MRNVVLIALLSVLPACSSSESKGTPDAVSDVTSDVGTNDTSSSADANPLDAVDSRSTDSAIAKEASVLDAVDSQTTDSAIAKEASVLDAVDSQTTDSAIAQDSAPATDSGADATGGLTVPACAVDANVAMPVTYHQIKSTATMPTALGIVGDAGSIADGTYVVSAMTVYNAATDSDTTDTQTLTLVISGNSVTQFNAAGIAGGTYAMTGNSLTLTYTCATDGLGGAETMAFTFSNNVLTFYIQGQGITFTKI